MSRGRSSESMIGNTYGLKHGGHKTPEYRAWRGMINRCENPNVRNYPSYGGRGIKVCSKWRGDFAAFLADVGPRPSDDHSIDRIDTDGDYEPGNVKWSTRSEQQQNKRRFLRGDACKRGHRYEEVGVYLFKNGARQCKKCALDRARKARSRAAPIRE